MEKHNGLSKLCAVLVFALAAISAISSFGYAESITFVQPYFLFIIVGILFAGNIYFKECKNYFAIISGAVLYIANLVVRTTVYVVNATVDFFANLRMEALDNKLSAATVGSDAYNKIADKIQSLQDVINKDVFGTVMCVITLVLCLAVFAYAIVMIVKILKRDEMEKTMIGKLTSKLIVAQNCKCKTQKTEKETVEIAETEETRTNQDQTENEQE